LIVPRRPLEKASLSGWSHFQYIIKSKLAKILFIGQSKYYARPKGELKIESKKIARDTNLILAAREARATPQNQWAALCAAHQMVGKKPLSQILVQLYRSARTYFIKNS
jgi:hypothetical protein